MSAWLIAACGCAYLYVCIEQAVLGNGMMSMVYGGYAFANVGLCVLATRP